MIGLKIVLQFGMPSDTYCSLLSLSLSQHICKISKRNYYNRMKMQFDVNTCDLLRMVATCWRWRIYMALHPFSFTLTSLTFRSIYRSILIASIRVSFSPHSPLFLFIYLIISWQVTQRKPLTKFHTYNSSLGILHSHLLAVNTSSLTYLIMSCNWLWLNRQFCKEHRVENVAGRCKCVWWFFESSNGLVSIS